MKLLDVLQEKGNPYWIPNCSRNDLPGLFKELGFKKGVEVGVFRGEFLASFCAEGFEMCGVDPWTDEEMNTVIKEKEPAETTYQRTVENVKPYANCKLIRKTSVEAVKDFEDNSLDFVYVDANHTFGHVAMDLMIWSEKVKKGGIISGHDYFIDDHGSHQKYIGHAKDAIDAFAKSYGFTNSWYVLGRRVPVRGEKRDRSVSFFMIKHW
jgi:hypothetical protein